MDHAHHHTSHSHHRSQGHDAHKGLNRIALLATLHCLTGCAIGEVAGLLIGTALGELHDAATFYTTSATVELGLAFLADMPSSVMVVGMLAILAQLMKPFAYPFGALSSRIFSTHA